MRKLAFYTAAVALALAPALALAEDASPGTAPGEQMGQTTPGSNDAAAPPGAQGDEASTPEQAAAPSDEQETQPAEPEEQAPGGANEEAPSSDQSSQ